MLPNQAAQLARATGGIGFMSPGEGIGFHLPVHRMPCEQTIPVRIEPGREGMGHVWDQVFIADVPCGNRSGGVEVLTALVTGQTNQQHVADDVRKVRANLERYDRLGTDRMIMAAPLQPDTGWRNEATRQAYTILVNDPEIMMTLAMGQDYRQAVLEALQSLHWLRTQRIDWPAIEQTIERDIPCICGMCPDYQGNSPIADMIRMGATEDIPMSSQVAQLLDLRGYGPVPIARIRITEA